MKLGINTYTFMWAIGFEGVRSVKPLTAYGLLEKARYLGLNVVQFGPNLPIDKLPEDEFERVIEQAKEWGIELELATRGLETEHLTQQAILCKRMGSKLLRTIPEIGGKKIDPELIPNYLHRILPVLDEHGLCLAFENGNLPAEELRKAIELAGSPKIGVVLDMVNSLAVSQGWKEVTRILAPYTMCLHYKDFLIRREWHMMGFTCEGRPAGRGQIDTSWLMDTLKASQYDFNIILELWPPEQATLAETIALESDWAIESIGYLRDWS